jgi:hypothetical protein
MIIPYVTRKGQPAGIYTVTINDCRSDGNDAVATRIDIDYAVPGFEKPLKSRVKPDLTPGSEFHRIVTAAMGSSFDQSGKEFDSELLKGKRLTVLVLKRKGPKGGYVIAHVFTRSELEDAMAKLAA